MCRIIGASNNRTNKWQADGTSQAQTLAAYKAGGFTAGTIAPCDSASLSENPTFLSTAGSSADFLELNPAVATTLNGSGTAISGYPTDFEGGTRNASIPDIGAYAYNSFLATAATYVRAPPITAARNTKKPKPATPTMIMKTLILLASLSLGAPGSASAAVDYPKNGS